MRRVSAVVLLLLVLGLVAWALIALPGSVRIEAGDFSAEAGMPAILLGAVVLVAVLYAVPRLLLAAVRLPRRLGRDRAARRAHAGEMAATRALLALIALHKEEAMTNADRARKLLGDTAQVLLLHAEAKRLAGRPAEAESDYALLAAKEDPALAGLRALLESARRKSVALLES